MGNVSGPREHDLRVENRVTGDVHGTVVQAGEARSVVIGADGVPLRSVDSLPTVKECDPVRLGVHRADDTDGASGITPYVGRDADTELCEHVRRASRKGGMVLVVGPSTAGKSRSAHQAVLAELPDHRILSPLPGESLAALADPAWGRGTEWLLWLDDLEEHLGEKGLSPDLLHELTGRRVPVVATMRSLYLHEPGTGSGSAPGPSGDPRYAQNRGPGRAHRMDRVVPAASVVRLERGWSHHEWEALALVDDPRLRRAYERRDLYTPGEYLTSSRPMLEDWNDALRPTSQGGHPRGHALVRAAVDLARVGLSAPQPRAFLEEVCVHYLGDADEARILRPEPADRAWAWATEQRYGVNSMLLPADPELTLWQAFDYLVDTDRPVEVPDSVWDAALERADDDGRDQIAQAALDAGQWDRAEKAWRPAAERGRARALHGLGRIAHDRGDPATAEYWYRRSVDETGDARGLNGMGVLCSDRLDDEGAAYWFRRAIDEHGYARSHRNYALDLMERSDLDGAERYLRAALDGGETDAYTNLGQVYQNRGQMQRAVACYRKAHTIGEPFGTLNLGHACLKAGLQESAEYWFTRTSEAHGEPVALAHEALARIQWKGGRVDDALASFQKAAGGGSRGALAWLGVQCTVDGDTEGSRGWFDRVLSAEQEPGADARAVADEFEARGLLPEAVAWARRAFREGGRQSGRVLSLVLQQTGERFEAEEVLHRAHTAGEPFTTNDLGVLAERRGATAEAEVYFREAAREGNPWGKYNLSLNLRKRGEKAAADRFMREAADSGHPTAAAELAEKGELDPESRRLYLERASHLGNTGAMLDLSRLLQGLPDDFGESHHWCRRAAERGLPAAVMEMAERAEADDRPDEAESWLRTAALEHHKLRAMYLLADLEEARGDPAEAEAWRRRARIHEPGPVSTAVSAADT